MDHTQSDGSYNIRYAIFLITCMCVGLPMSVWALRLVRLYHQRQQPPNSGSCGSSSKASWSFVTALLFTDLLEALLSPAMVAYLFSPVAQRSGVVFVLFYRVKFCGAHLHQMVALEAALVRSSALKRSGRCGVFAVVASAAQATFLLLCLYVDDFLHSPGVTFAWLLLAAIPLILTCIITLRCPPFKPDSTGQESGYGYTVLTIAASSFVLLYGPFLAFVLAQALSPQAASIEKYVSGLQAAMTVIHPAVCLRLLTDPLLCVLVIRESLLAKRPEVDDQN